MEVGGETHDALSIVASGILYSPLGQALVQRWRPERFPGGVSGQPEAGADQEQGDDRKHQEVPRWGQETWGIGCAAAGSEEIC